MLIPEATNFSETLEVFPTSREQEFQFHESSMEVLTTSEFCSTDGYSETPHSVHCGTEVYLLFYTLFLHTFRYQDPSLVDGWGPDERPYLPARYAHISEFIRTRNR